MKVLFDCQMPFQLAHGGAQTQIEETMRAVARAGCEVEPLRWWDDQQTSDLIHTFALPSVAYGTMAHLAGRPVVSTTLLTSNCNHPDWRLKLQGAARRFLYRVPGGKLFINQTFWNDYLAVDQLVVGLAAEAQVLTDLYGVDPGRIARVPLALPAEFLQAPPPGRSENYLVTTGTITDRKRSVDLARLAHAAQVPILFIGKAYSEDDAYWQEFRSLIDGKFVLHQPHVHGRREMIDLLQSARGFVIYSRHENWCLSAHEAVACGLPILVQDQKWSRECFGDGASYLKNTPSPENVERLRNFHRCAPDLSAPPIKLYGWDEVGRRLVTIYQALLDKFRGVSPR